MKGETSGHTLEVTDIDIDCDRDTLLYRVTAQGPACHRGTGSCFDGPDDVRPAGFFSLERLDAVIAEREVGRPDGSYTASLLVQGVDGPARKVIEEATEVALAAKDHDAGTADDRRVAEEAADLLFHTLVLLRQRGVPAALVMEVLKERSRPRQP